MFEFVKNSNSGFAPLRTLDDFLLESARFQLPNFTDWEKWGHRVANNLLYYQSNYFILSIIIFIIVGIIHPLKMAGGIAVTLVILSVFWYATNENSPANRFKKNHPIVSVVMVIAGICLTMNMLDSVLVCCLGILLPFSVMFLHASLRLRNLKNKFANQAENFNLKQTPMGLFLKQCGLMDDTF